METRKVLTILVLALGLMAWLPSVGRATPLGTAFTYQGHLYDANYVADGLYDFQFKLFDAVSDGNQISVDVNRPDIDVIDAYFTVKLDFGSDVFDGNAVWLEIGVRPGEQSDPCEYTFLSPRQEVMPTPYALYAKTAGSGGGGADLDWQISGNDMYSIPSGNVGIGTTLPGEKLHVAGSTRIGNGDPGEWAGLFLYGDSQWLLNAHNTTDALYIRHNQGTVVDPNFSDLFVTVKTNGNVGIGTVGPSSELDVVGSIRSSDAGDSTGAVLLSGPDGSPGLILLSNDPEGYRASIVRETDGLGFGIHAATGNPGSDEFFIHNNGNVGIGTVSPSAKLDVHGYIVVTQDVVYSSPKTRYLSIPCVAFRPSTPDQDYWNGKWWLTGKTPGQAVAFQAPINLPHGAEITKYEALIFDDSSNDIEFNMVYHNISGSTLLISNISSSGTPGKIRLSSPALSATVNNQDNAYLIEVLWTTPTPEDDIKLYQVNVFYTVTNSVP